jgi:hypothetical protein
MSTYVTSVEVVAPSQFPHPHLAIAIERLITWIADLVEAYRSRHAAELAQRAVQTDAAAARREAYRMMRYDPRVAAEMLVAADRHEAMYL